MFNFDLHKGFVLLRIIVGAFMLPHAYGKVKYREGVTGFFNAAGLKPAALFINFGLVFEIVAGIALIVSFGPQVTQIAAALTCVFMLVATVANHKVCQGKWLWNMGGSEYPLFWGLCAAIVAMNPT